MVTTNGVRGPGNLQPTSKIDRFRVGARHLGRVGNYFFGTGRRFSDDRPLGVFVDLMIKGVRPGIIFDHGQLGLMTGEEVEVQIETIKGRGINRKFNLGLVRRAGPGYKAEVTDIGPFMIVPNRLWPSPSDGPGKDLDALIPKPLAGFSVSGQASEQERQLIDKGITVTCPLNKKQYRFLAPEAVWQMAQDLANGKRISVTIGRYILGGEGARQALLPTIPGYAPALIDMPGYGLANEDEAWEVYLKDYFKSNFEDVARQIGEGKLRLSLVPKPMKGQVFRSEKFSYLSPLFVSVPRPNNNFWTYSLERYFTDMYRPGDEIEIVLIGERGEHPYHRVICAPVRELKQLEEAIETLRQGAEVEIMATGFQSSYSSEVQIKVRELTFPVQIVFGDKPVQTFTAGQKVRLSLAAEISERSFQGNEFLWVNKLHEHGMNHINLTMID